MRTATKTVGSPDARRIAKARGQDLAPTPDPLLHDDDVELTADEGDIKRVEVVVHGRNVEVPDHFRAKVEEKLARLERYDNKIITADVELQHEKNRRQHGSCQHIEITCVTRGPVVRAEACAADFYSALDTAVEKLERRLRQAADRRRVHHGRRTPMSVARATAALDQQTQSSAPEPEPDGDDGPGRVVRIKDHPGAPITTDQALHEMELVGHDFYLFCDVETGRPSVVYRRHAYDYGLLRLAT